jgi:hypothetical protein
MKYYRSSKNRAWIPRLPALGSILVLALTTLISALPANAEDEQPVGFVVSAVGKSTVERDGQPIALETGSPVYEYDVIYTGEDAYLAIRLLDESELRVGAGSMVYMKEHLNNVASRRVAKRMHASFSPHPAITARP